MGDFVGIFVEMSQVLLNRFDIPLEDIEKTCSRYIYVFDEGKLVYHFSLQFFVASYEEYREAHVPT